MCCLTMSSRILKLEILIRHCPSLQQIFNRSFHNSKILRSAPDILSKVNIKSEEDANVHEIQEFVSTLTTEKRLELLQELQKTESLEARKKAEDKLASRRWRSRFGRPSMHNLGADPTGTFCEIPEGWLKEKAAVAAEPTSKQLKQLCLFNALPFIGFGFLDNVIMILAGEYIDLTIGTALGISTLAAAALGNTISDLAGIGSVWYVESAAEKIGVRAPPLTPQQLETSGARWSANAGRAFGVVFGCILGMFPLLFMSKSRDEEKSENKAQPVAADK